MLILTRKIDQAVYIGLGGVVRVLGVERDRVKLGFDFPDGVSIVREELLEHAYDEATRPVVLGAGD